MDEQNQRGNKLKFFIILVVAVAVTLFIVRGYKKVESNENPKNEKPIATTSDITEAKDNNPVIIGSNPVTVIQSVLEFLKSSYKSEMNNFNMDIYSEGIKNYENKEFEKAYFAFKKNYIARDPVSSILTENARILGTKDELVKIAISTPLTGDTSEMGVKELLGAALAQEEINKLGGIAGKKLYIQLADDRDDKVQVSKVASELALDKEILGVIGHYSSSVSLEGAKIYEQAGVVEISPSSSSPRLSSAGKYIFRVCPSDTEQGKFIANNAIRKFGTDKNFQLVYNPDEAYSKGLADAISQTLLEAGASLSQEYTYNSGTVDFQEIVNKISQSNGNVVFYTGSDVEGSYFIKEMQENGKDINVFSGDAMYTSKILNIANNNPTNLYFSAFFHSDAGYSFQENFVKSFLKKFEGGSPNAVCALTYDAVYTLKKAIEISQRFDREGVLDGMYKVNFEGATGRIKFDANGDIPNKMMVMLKVNNGAFKPIK